MGSVPDDVSYEWMFPQDQGNQGQFGACVSFAIASFMETALKKHHGINISISRRALYAMAQRQFEPQWLGKDSGLFCEDGLRTAEQGYVRDEDWPYAASPDSFFDEVPATLVRSDEKLLKYVRVTGSEDPVETRFEKMHVALDKLGNLLLGQTFPTDWFAAGADRKVTANPVQGEAGGHEMIVAGSSRSRRFIVARCAWENYGDRGWIEIPWDVAAEFAPLDVYAAVAP